MRMKGTAYWKWISYSNSLLNYLRNAPVEAEQMGLAPDSTAKGIPRKLPVYSLLDRR